jgi:DNA polymerase III alpha subunit
MKYDQYGQCWTTPSELADMLYQDPSLPIGNFLIKGSGQGWDDANQYNSSVEEFYADFPTLKYIRDIDIPVDEFHRLQQEHWHMPDDYLDMDIAKWLLDECKSQAELQRVGEELLLFQERDLFNLLKYLKYMVDTFRKKNIVWGLGRGSSVASFVLYLIGVHKINSLYYDLNIDEFLK